MNVKEIVADWLKAAGYDGLWNEDGECGCAVGDDFMPCGCESVTECVGGFKIKCNPETCAADGDCKYHIGPEKDKEEVKA